LVRLTARLTLKWAGFYHIPPRKINADGPGVGPNAGLLKNQQDNRGGFW
jgi:hypothetical protein